MFGFAGFSVKCGEVDQEIRPGRIIGCYRGSL